MGPMKKRLVNQLTERHHKSKVKNRDTEEGKECSNHKSAATEGGKEEKKKIHRGEKNRVISVGKKRNFAQ